METSELRNHPALEKLRLGMAIGLEGAWDMMDASKRCRIVDCDGPCCDLDTMNDVEGVEFMMLHADSIIESHMVGRTGSLPWLRERGFPSAMLIAALIRAWYWSVDSDGLDDACLLWFGDYDQWKEEEEKGKEDDQE